MLILYFSIRSFGGSVNLISGDRKQGGGVKSRLRPGLDSMSAYSVHWERVKAFHAAIE